MFYQRPSKDEAANRAFQSALRAYQYTRVIVLNFNQMKMGHQLFEKIITSPHLQDKYIKSINLRGNQIDDTDLRNAKMQIFYGIVHLDLSMNLITEIGCITLSSIKWKNIRLLNLQKNKIGSFGLSNLARQSSWFSQLTHLNLNSTGLIDQNLANLFNSHSLKSLSLSDNRLSSKALKHLSNGSFQYLEFLNLQKNLIENVGFELLISIKLPSLQNLNLGQNKIEKQGMKLLPSAQWPRLKALTLSYNTIQNQGCKYLRQSKLRSIQFLALSNCSIRNEGIKWLSKANWSELKTLHLDLNEFEYDGYCDLVKMNFPKIQILVLNGKYCNNEFNRQSIKLDIKPKLLKLYERQGYYGFYRRTQDTIQMGEFWSDQFEKVFPKTTF